ncbi:uncharacterized protein METZ01_LOCUS301767 [marine metagenome]|uniref:Uncharacterized protein n=1 Tax=marine metagenome TaxID=408172 RepID=A0A382MIU2_9ZZZZ
MLGMCQRLELTATLTGPLVEFTWLFQRLFKNIYQEFFLRDQRHRT